MTEFFTPKEIWIGKHVYVHAVMSNARPCYFLAEVIGFNRELKTVELIVGDDRICETFPLNQVFDKIRGHTFFWEIKQKQKN